MSPRGVRLLVVLVLMAPLTGGVAPVAGAGRVGTLPTGAGFSLSIARPAMGLYPTAARLQASGLPAFPRHTRGGSQVIVGPYAAIDEALAVQRQLSASGVRTRLLVDESVRRVRGDGASVLLIAGAGRLSLVIELTSEPRHVFTRRDGPVLEVEAGPLDHPVEARVWHAPEGISVLERVSIETAGQTLRTRVVLSDTARTTIRIVGHRLYVDLWSAESEMVGRPFENVGRPAADVVGRVAMVRHDDVVPPEAAPPYGVRIAPAVARFQSMEPFVLSSVAAPSPEVLAALEGSLRGLEGWIQEIEAPAESAQHHASLIASVRLAREAVHPGFTGDRQSRAREAFERVKKI
jgi:hypothetical protein